MQENICRVVKIDKEALFEFIYENFIAQQEEINKMNQKEIRAVYNDAMIRVYQAYCREIAEEAVKLGTFGKHFNLDRMTLIKPSFLWMMYRCGWAGTGVGN